MFTPFAFRSIKAEVAAPSGPVYQFRTDAYSASLKLAIPGALFTDLGMSNYYDDVSADIRGTGTNFTANPTGSGSEFYEDTSNIKWSSEGYDSSVFTDNAGSWGAIPTADFGIGSGAFVLEGWVYMTERFNKPPFWKVGLRDANYRISIEMGFPASGTTDWKSRIIINDSQYFSSNQNIAFNLNEWIHLAWVRTSGGTFYTYINGTRYTHTGSTTASVGTGNNTRIFRGENTTNDGTAGAWQDFRFYVGTDKGYTTSTITTPDSMVELV